jgi:hypothetical protein
LNENNDYQYFVIFVVWNQLVIFRLFESSYFPFYFTHNALFPPYFIWGPTHQSVRVCLMALVRERGKKATKKKKKKR